MLWWLPAAPSSTCGSQCCRGCADTSAFNPLPSPAESCSLGQPQGTEQPEHSWLLNLLVRGIRQKHLCNLSFVILKIKINANCNWRFYFPFPHLSLSLPLWIIPTMNFTMPSSSLALQAELFDDYSDTKAPPVCLGAVWHFKQTDHKLHMFPIELLESVNRKDNFSIPSSHNQLFKWPFFFYYNDFFFNLEIDFPWKPVTTLLGVSDIMV